MFVYFQNLQSYLKSRMMNPIIVLVPHLEIKSPKINEKSPKWCRKSWLWGKNNKRLQRDSNPVRVSPLLHGGTCQPRVYSIWLGLFWDTFQRCVKNYFLCFLIIIYPTIFKEKCLKILHSETCKSGLYQKCPFIKKSTIFTQS